MLRFFTVVLFAVVAVCATLAASAYASDAQTIRVEPRAIYGATVSLEAGVRVYRPLPPTKKMIINSGNSPVNISVNETKKTVTHRSKATYPRGTSGSGYYGAGSVGGYIPFHRFKGRHKGGGHGRRGGGRPGRF